MKKGILLMALGLLWLTPISSLAASDVQNHSSKVLLQNKELKHSDLLKKDYKYKSFKIKGKTFEEPKMELKSVLQDESGKKFNDIEESKGTQLLDVQENEDGSLTSDYVTVANVTVTPLAATDSNVTVTPLAATDSNVTITPLTATDAEAHTNWIGNTTGTVTVYYHIVTQKDTVDSVQMDYITVSWSPGSSDVGITNRIATMYENGKTTVGTHFANHQDDEYVSKDSTTRFNVPTTWEPIYEGYIGGKSSASVIQNAKIYTLKVDCIMSR